MFNTDDFDDRIFEEINFNFCSDKNGILSCVLTLKKFSFLNI